MIRNLSAKSRARMLPKTANPTTSLNCHPAVHVAVNEQRACYHFMQIACDMQHGTSDNTISGIAK
eukprot:933523-Amphidinium_carterae.1